MMHELPRTAQVVAFPPARNARNVDRLMHVYVALWRRHGYDKARRIFEARELAPIRARLRGIGVPAAEIDRELYALTVAMRQLYDTWTGRLEEHSA